MTWQPLVPATPYKNGQPMDPALLGDWTMFSNDTYVVLRRELEATDGGPPLVHLSIRRQDRRAARDWRDFQRIKNQLAGPEFEGIEIYPQESRKIDTANQYHLWCLPFRIGFGLGGERMVTDPDVTAIGEPGAVQRKHEEADGPLNTAEEMKEWLKNHPEA